MISHLYAQCKHIWIIMTYSYVATTELKSFLIAQSLTKENKEPHLEQNFQHRSTFSENIILNLNNFSEKDLSQNKIFTRKKFLWLRYPPHYWYLPKYQIFWKLTKLESNI